MERARVNAEKEADEISQRANLQSRKILVQVETMKAAAQEEMETQCIYTQVARLKAESLESLSEVRVWIGELPSKDPTVGESSGPDQQRSQAESPVPVHSETATDAGWATPDQPEEPAIEQSQEPPPPHPATAPSPPNVSPGKSRDDPKGFFDPPTIHAPACPGACMSVL